MLVRICMEPSHSGTAMLRLRRKAASQQLFFFHFGAGHSSGISLSVFFTYQGRPYAASNKQQLFFFILLLGIRLDYRYVYSSPIRVVLHVSDWHMSAMLAASPCCCRKWTGSDAHNA